MDDDIEAQIDFNSERINQDNFRRHLVTNRWQLPNSQRCGQNGIHVSQNLQESKSKPVQKLGPSRDQGTLLNGSKIWIKKCKAENEGGLEMESAERAWQPNRRE